MVSIIILLCLHEHGSLAQLKVSPGSAPGLDSRMKHNGLSRESFSITQAPCLDPYVHVGNS